jgi:Ion channel
VATKLLPLQFVRLNNRYKKYKRSTDRNWVPPRVSLIGQITLYLIPAIIVFIFFPAMLFTYFEDWDYTISIYYAFVTLTTIGEISFSPHLPPGSGAR